MTQAIAQQNGYTFIEDRTGHWIDLCIGPGLFRVRYLSKGDMPGGVSTPVKEHSFTTIADARKFIDGRVETARRVKKEPLNLAVQTEANTGVVKAIHAGNGKILTTPEIECNTYAYYSGTRENSLYPVHSNVDVRIAQLRGLNAKVRQLERNQQEIRLQLKKAAIIYSARDGGDEVFKKAYETALAEAEKL